MEANSRGALALVVSTAAVFIMIVASPVGAINPIFGTVQANGPAWVSDTGDGWDTLKSTRPLVAGERLKTGDGGYVLLDLGAQGVVGMYNNTEISAGEDGDAAMIDVVDGKLAFHLSEYSAMRIAALDAEIYAPEPRSSADGYVEINEHGDAVLAVEEGELAVSVAGVDRKLAKGQRMLLNEQEMGATPERMQMASQHESAEEERDKAAGLAASDEDDDSEAGVLFGLSGEELGVGAVGTVAAVVVIDQAADSSSGDGGGSP